MKPIEKKLTEISLTSWSEFSSAIHIIRANYGAPHENQSELLYRGVPKSNIKLQSSLESSTLSNSGVLNVRQYFDLMEHLRPEIESHIGSSFSEIRDPRSLGEIVYDGGVNTHWYPHYDYMVYLRHHGFPSPLLDWSASPYVAAYFAFKWAQPTPPEDVAIYVLLEYGDAGGKVWDEGQPHILKHGPRVRAHERHFRQQSRYTVCVEKKDGLWSYVPYDTLIRFADLGQDILWKICIPYSDRELALSELDAMNVNAYSLFNTNDSLMETLYNRHARCYIGKPAPTLDTRGR